MIFFPSHEITIRRLRQGAGYHQNFSATFTAYQADIQPFDVGRTNAAGGRIGTLYDCFMEPDSPIAEGDQLDAGSKRYSVKAVNRFEGAGLLDSIHCVLESQDG